MSTFRTTLQSLPALFGWVLAAGSMALAGVTNLRGDSSINASVMDGATGGDDVVLAASSNAPTIGASLSIRVDSEDGDGALVLEWTGQPQSAILVVSVDSQDLNLTRPRIVGTGELHGILLLRSIRSTGHAAIVFDTDTLAGVLDDPNLLISVKVVPRLRVQDVVYAPTKSPPRILHKEWLSPADCPASFQLLDRGDTLDATTFGDIARLRVGRSHEGRIQAIVDVDSIVASLQLRLTLGLDDPIKP